MESWTASLEVFCTAQYTAATVADNWGGQFEERFVELEQRVGNLELIRITEIHDERYDRVFALESATSAL
ncbi:unnamed protein product [Miscanthus lutarioriparius]|uniref:Uncharacterized protein n=1 Tax=Miscanthus lutarioriparius TaxID=422564 RepID=A0A811P7F6_9POAL|nr:unnamed protein product [Miscanthus lutarioriparius]